MKDKIFCGDAEEVLKTFPEECIDMCITSPPYYSLRDYGVENQLGQEDTPQEYITRLCNIFDEVGRVLKKEGTLWVNIGDSYNGSGKAGKKGSAYQKKHTEFGKPSKHPERFGKPTKVKKIQRKSLIGIPERFVIEMTDRGWVRRGTVIWKKTNQMPTSAKDRFTDDFEYLYYFSKQPKYYFEQQFEDVVPNSDVAYRSELRKGKQYNSKEPYKKNLPIPKNSTKRNKRSVWEIPTKPYKGAHFSVFPKELLETPVKAGCPVGGVVLDPFIGSGTVAEEAKRQNKNYVGIELNPDYLPLIKERLNNDNTLEKKKPLNEERKEKFKSKNEEEK
jgi:DNA modification methylase